MSRGLLLRGERVARLSPRVGRWIPPATVELEEWSSPLACASDQGDRIRLMDSFRPEALQPITGGLRFLIPRRSASASSCSPL
jgi:hypothetical protein